MKIICVLAIVLMYSNSVYSTNILNDPDPLLQQRLQGNGFDEVKKSIEAIEKGVDHKKPHIPQLMTSIIDFNEKLGGVLSKGSSELKRKMYQESLDAINTASTEGRLGIDQAEAFYNNMAFLLSTEEKSITFMQNRGFISRYYVDIKNLQPEDTMFNRNKEVYTYLGVASDPTWDLAPMNLGLLHKILPLLIPQYQEGTDYTKVKLEFDLRPGGIIEFVEHDSTHRSIYQVLLET